MVAKMVTLRASLRGIHKIFVKLAECFVRVFTKEKVFQEKLLEKADFIC